MLFFLVFVYLVDLLDKRAGEVGARLAPYAVLFADKFCKVIDSVRDLVGDGVDTLGQCVAHLF
jgi:hypothetical protein